MDTTFLAIAIIPLVMGAAIFVGLLLLTVVMPGDAKAGAKEAPKAVPAPARGPEYVALTAKRKGAYRQGLFVLLGLAALTVIEFAAAFAGSTLIMFVFIVLKGAMVMYFFMHITSVWKSEEAH